MTSPKDKTSFLKPTRDVSECKSSDAGPSTKRRLEAYSDDEASAETETKRLQSDKFGDFSSSATASTSTATSTSANASFVLVPVASTESSSFPPEFPTPVAPADSLSLSAITESYENKSDLKPESDESGTALRCDKRKTIETITESKEAQTYENKSSEPKDDLVDCKLVDTVKPEASDAITISEPEAKPVVLDTEEKPKDITTSDLKPAPYVFVPPRDNDAPFVFSSAAYPSGFPIPTPPTGPVTFSVNPLEPKASDSATKTVSSGIEKYTDSKDFDSDEPPEPIKVKVKRQRKLAEKGKRRSKNEEDVYNPNDAKDSEISSDDDAKVTGVDTISGGKIKDISAHKDDSTVSNADAEENGPSVSLKVDFIKNSDETADEGEITDDTSSPIANSGPFIVDVTDILTPTPEPEAHDDSA